jgi:hypothetical protein
VHAHLQSGLFDGRQFKAVAGTPTTPRDCQLLTFTFHPHTSGLPVADIHLPSAHLGAASC